MKKIVVANWKMNPKSVGQAKIIASEIVKKILPLIGYDLVICPPSLYLRELRKIVKLTSIKLGVQNVSDRDSGPFTGEISAPMVKPLASFAIIGHSERRTLFGETDEMVNLKVINVLAHGLRPIICMGENLEQMRRGETEVVIDQAEAALKNVGPKYIEKITIAYEPVWAIGTGKNADAEYANQKAYFIRQAIASHYNREIASKIPILYGGSVDAENVAEFINQAEINGVLVGGLSVQIDKFIEICEKIGK